MAFVLAGFVARAVPSLPAISVAPLPAGFALISLRDSDGSGRLTDEAAAAAAELSARGRLVYVEAEFFGGTGTQAALGWEDGRIALQTQSPGAINEALRWLGVQATDAEDEFDALGLGRHDELRRDDQCTADRAVQSFLDAIEKLSTVFEAELGERLFQLLVGVRQKGRDPEGVIAPGVRYAVHGAGCRFTLLDGSAVDVNVGTERPDVAFDGWRIHWFAESLGYEVPVEDARAALGEAAGVVEVRPGWFQRKRPGR